MAKLPKKFQFIDLSDYGRPAGHWIAKRFQNTTVTPIHVTTMFVITGLLSVGFMIIEYYVTAAFFIILKSILDAADGELSRLKNTPSYVGRYYDSIADILLNFCFLSALSHLIRQNKTNLAACISFGLNPEEASGILIKGYSMISLEKFQEIMQNFYFMRYFEQKYRKSMHLALILRTAYCTL